MGYKLSNEPATWLTEAVKSFERGNNVFQAKNAVGEYAAEISEAFAGTDAYVIYAPPGSDLESVDNFDATAAEYVKKEIPTAKFVMVFSGDEMPSMKAVLGEDDIVGLLNRNDVIDEPLDYALNESASEILSIVNSLTASEKQQDYVFKSVQALKQDNVVQIDQAPESMFEEVQAEFTDTNIAVVYWPEDANLDGYTVGKLANAKTAADLILEDAPDEIDTVVLYSGQDSMVASERGLDKILETLDDNHVVGSSNIERSLILSSEEIQDYNQITTGDWLPVTGGITSLVLTLMIVPVYFSVRADKRKALKESDSYKIKKRAKAEAKALKEKEKLLKKQLWRKNEKYVSQAELRKTMPVELAETLDSIDVINHSEIVTFDQEFCNALDEMTDDVYSLFDRLEKIGSDRQKALAKVEYDSTLSKVQGLVKTFAAVSANPEHWDAAEERLEKVRAAITAAHHQVVNNIRQLNASQDLRFEADVQRLTADNDRFSSDKPK